MHRLAYLANFFLTSGAGIVFVVLADLKEDFGLLDWQIGMIASIGFGTALLASLFLSPFADRGHVYQVAVAGVVIGITGNVLFGLAQDFTAFLVARACIGVGLGLYLAAARKAIIGTDTEGSGQKLGILLSTNVAGFLIGPALGWLLRPFGFGAPFFVVAVLIALAATPTLWWMKNVNVATSVVRLRDMAPLFRLPRIRAALLAQLFLFGNIGMFDSVADLYLTDLGASERTVVLLIWAFGMPLLILPGLAGGFIDRHNPSKVLLVSIFLAVPTIAAFGIWQTLTVFAVAAVIEGTIESFAFPAAQVVVVRETGAEEAAIGQSLVDASGYAAAATAAALGPILYGAGGALAVYGSMGVVGLVLALGSTSQIMSANRRAALPVA